jgi:outer membrane immunogenic protein
VHIGGAWADLSTTDLDGYWTDVPSTAPLNTKQTPSGVFGGGTIGYNMQRGGVVFGFEADFGVMGLNGNRQITNPNILLNGDDETAFAHISLGFYGDLTGRLGWAWAPWLLYGKGGFAVLEAKTYVNEADFVPRSTLAPRPSTTRALAGRLAAALSISGTRPGA